MSAEPPKRADSGGGCVRPALHTNEQVAQQGHPMHALRATTHRMQSRHYIKSLVMLSQKILFLGNDPECPLVQGLRAAGHDVLAHAQNTGPMTAVLRHMPHLILLELGHAQFDAVDLCRQIKRNRAMAAVPIVFYSTFLDAGEARLKVLAAGAQGSTHRGLSDMQAVALVEDLLARRRPLLPANEAERLDALRRYRVLDTPPEVLFDDLTKVASIVCKTPIALVSLVDSDRQWFKSKVGLDVAETSRDLAFCAHAIHDTQIMEVQNATEDERFAQNPLVTSDPNIRFYAGAPLVNTKGLAVGTLCVIDRVPRNLTDEQRTALQALGRVAIHLLETRA